MGPSPQARERRFVRCSFALAATATALCTIVVALGLFELGGAQFKRFEIVSDGKSLVFFLLLILVDAKLVHSCALVWRRYRELGPDGSRTP